VSSNLPPDQLFDSEGAGRYLGGERPFSPRTLERWRLQGRGPRYVRIGRSVRYKQSALDDFLRAGERSSDSAMGRRLRLKTLVTLNDAGAWLASLPKSGGEVAE
jgi:hypothetical protein